MTELRLYPGAAATVPAADRALAEPRIAAVDGRRRDEARARRRFDANRLAVSDDGFRLFRVY